MNSGRMFLIPYPLGTEGYPSFPFHSSTKSTRLEETNLSYCAKCMAFFRRNTLSDTCPCKCHQGQLLKTVHA